MFKTDCGVCAHFEVCKYPEKLDSAEYILEQKIRDVSFLDIAVVCRHFILSEKEHEKEAKD